VERDSVKGAQVGRGTLFSFKVHPDFFCFNFILFHFRFNLHFKAEELGAYMASTK
jgi:hypothetical protein